MATKKHKYSFNKSEVFGVDIPESWLQNYQNKDGQKARYGGDGCNNEELNGKSLLEVLLYDHTTKRNIVWGTEDYGFSANSEIKTEQICDDRDLFSERNVRIRPRVAKDKEEQRKRIREKAEVFTPSWVCNKQNNQVDEAWFGRPHVFNIEIDSATSHSWKSCEKIIVSHDEFTDYISDHRLEITCGEAPYLVNRYDTTTGEIKPLNERIGFLDRKLRLNNQEEEDRSKWMKNVKKSFMSLYGYEWQGDNLLLAREAMFYSFIEYYRAKWNEEPNISTLFIIAEIISWNLWQMDGLTNKVPYTEQLAQIKNWGKLKAERVRIFAFQDLLTEKKKQ